MKLIIKQALLTLKVLSDENFREGGSNGGYEWPDSHQWSACNELNKNWKDGDCVHICFENGLCDQGFIFADGPMIDAKSSRGEDLC